MKKFVSILAAAALCACTAVTAFADFNADRSISVVSREDGSGTRGAFIELFGIEEKDAEGNKTDMTTQEAIVVNSTDVVLTTVAGDESAIGYVSLGSLNDTVKALKIDGVSQHREHQGGHLHHLPSLQYRHQGRAHRPGQGLHRFHPER